MSSDGHPLIPSREPLRYWHTAGSHVKGSVGLEQIVGTTEVEGLSVEIHPAQRKYKYRIARR
jgi:hypothetical protein